jgi:hypothetical protein
MCIIISPQSLIGMQDTNVVMAGLDPAIHAFLA